MRRLIVLLVAAAMFTVGCSSSDPTASDEYVALEQELAQAETLLADAVALSETIEAVEANETAYVEAFLAQDLDAFMDTFTDDAVFVDETFGDYFDGKMSIRSMYSNVIRIADPDVSEVIDLIVSDDGMMAASTWEWIGTNLSGKPFNLPIALFHEYRDGKIVRETVYYASPNAREQLLGSP